MDLGFSYSLRYARLVHSDKSMDSAIALLWWYSAFKAAKYDVM
jgi:hypothetical protein